MKAIRISRLLCCLAVVGVAATAVMSAIETPDAKEAIEEAKKEDLDPIHTVAKVAPKYTKTIIVGTATTALIFGSNHMLYRNVRAVTEAYTNLNRSYKDYKTAVAGVLGIAGEAALSDQVAREHGVTAEPIGDPEREPIDVGVGIFRPGEVGPDLWFYEPITRTYFLSTAFEVMSGFCGINQEIANNFFVSVRDALDMLKIPEEYWPKAKALGWDQNFMMDEYDCMYVPFHFRAMNYDNEHPGCYEIVYEIDPEICAEGLD